MKNKQFFYGYFLPVIIFTGSVLTSNAQQLLPVPQQATFGKGRFVLDSAKALISPSATSEEREAINALIDDIKESTGLVIGSTYVSEPGKALIVIESGHSGPLLPVPGETAGKESRESYTLSVKPDRIFIKAKSDAGVFYALQTLRQLIISERSTVYIPETEIEDYPGFAYRGIMMDLSHGGLPTEAEIRRQIDFLAKWKINQYYFYNEVSIEMKGYPLMNYQAQYSQEQIKRIVAYGKSRYMDVIPFVNFYGHLHEMLRHQKYTTAGIGHYGHDLDPRQPPVKAMLKDWIRQYADLFPSPFIHIGFDETWETVRLAEKNPAIHPEQWFVDHLAFVNEEVGRYGKTAMVWTDISKTYPGIIAKFPKNIIPVVWDYSDNPESVNSWITPIKKQKLPFFIQPAVDGWAHLYPTETTWSNIDLCLKAANDNKALGYITSVWTDAVQPMLRNSWMFMAYGAVVSWQNKPMERNAFIDAYAQIEYPDVQEPMAAGFKKLSESQVHLRKRLGQTQTRMWLNPFLAHNLKKTGDNLPDYENGRLAAEEAQEYFMQAMQANTKDSSFIRSILLNSRLLSYTASRFLWAKKITDRWNETMSIYGKKEGPWYNDIGENPHGLIMDMLDYTTEIREEYRLSWLSENIPYRLGTMTGRFDAEYLFWRNLSLKLLDYRDNKDAGNKRVDFGKTFRLE